MKRAVVIFIEDEGIDEFTDFKTETGCYDLCDVLNKYKHQYLHFDRRAQFEREVEALVKLLPCAERGLDTIAIKSRFNNLKVNE